jgi:tripeptide aminopeptidase
MGDQLRGRVLERFLRYVRIDTQSNEASSGYPSTEKQLVLLRALVDELKALGLGDAAIDEWGYVTATIPATPGCESVPAIGLISHVDTSPEMPGAGVKPIVHADYRGQDLVLPDDPTAVLRLAETPALAEQIGQEIVTASGTTLLGADDKAGVAEIVTAAEHLLAHPEVAHGPIRIGFTPDEEVGRGTLHFDVERFGARFAYTVDGESLGEIQYESFSADTLVAAFQGFNTHPGYGKDKLVNAIKVASDFVARIPKGEMSPETTAEREGYVHPYVFEGGVDRVTVRVLIRDFRTAALAEKEALLESLARATVADWPGSAVEIKIEESYRNMREVIDLHPEVVAHAREAIARAGLEVREHPIRGGTDGSRLSFMGLPTPNLFAGSHNFHSRLEWVSVRDLAKAVEVIVNLAAIWAERSRG